MVNRLRTIATEGGEAYIDFRLQELRLTTLPSVAIDFINLDKATKKLLRGIRAEFGPNEYIPGLDD